ncbi:MAG: hypothetical protein V3U45_08390 [bacterium]
MTVLSPVALESLDRSFLWDTFCGCGRPAAVSYRGEYYCHRCWGAR